MVMEEWVGTFGRWKGFEFGGMKMGGDEKDRKPHW